MTTVLIVAMTALAGGERPFFSVEARQDANPADYLPCDIGDRWVYNNQYATALGPEGWMVNATWTTTRTVRERVTIPEGLLVIIECATTNWLLDAPANIPQDKLESFTRRVGTQDAVSYQLVAGPYVHSVPEWAWDAEKRSMVDRYRTVLLDGEDPPDLFFPLGSASAWADKTREKADREAADSWKAGQGPAPNPNMFYWHYFGIEDVTVPIGALDGVHHFKWFDNTGHTDVWFKDGVGVVKEVYEHNGTYIESTSELVSFTEGIASGAPSPE